MSQRKTSRRPIGRTWSCPAEWAGRLGCRLLPACLVLGLSTAVSPAGAVTLSATPDRRTRSFPTTDRAAGP